MWLHANHISRLYLGVIVEFSVNWWRQKCTFGSTVATAASLFSALKQSSSFQKILSKPWELAQAKCDKNGRRLEGPREEQRQQQDVIVALYTDSCHRVAWSWETDSSAKTAVPAPRLVFICTSSCSFYICCLRIIVPNIFHGAWQTLAVSTMTDWEPTSWKSIQTQSC